jgi:hypothetical protein
LRYGVGAGSVLIPIRGFFERRGRKGFAEGAEKKIPKKYKNLEKDKEEKKKSNLYEWHTKSFQFSELFCIPLCIPFCIFF